MMTDLLLTALYTVFVQNLVFSAGFGMSEAVRVAQKPGRFVSFAVMISGFSVATGAICRVVSKLPVVAAFSFPARAALYGGILAAVYLLTALLLRLLRGADRKRLGALGIAALNTLVFAVPFLNEFAAYSLAESIVSGLAAGVAFVLAAAVIGKGTRMLERNENIPAIFRGTPALLLYIGLISLGFLGFTGTSLFS